MEEDWFFPGWCQIQGPTTVTFLLLCHWWKQETTYALSFRSKLSWGESKITFSPFKRSDLVDQDHVQVNCSLKRELQDKNWANCLAKSCQTSPKFLSAFHCTIHFSAFIVLVGKNMIYWSSPWFAWLISIQSPNRKKRTL